MSHYTVLVIAGKDDDIEELLAPFDENLEVEPYIEYTKQDIIDRVGREDAAKLEEMKQCKEDNSECYIGIWGLGWDNKGRRIPTDDDIAFAEKCVNEFEPEDAYARYRKDMDEDEYPFYDEDGNELSTYNPNSKWDWYTIGGRWSGGIPTKSGKNVDFVAVKDISWELNADSIEYASRFWDVVVEGAPLQDSESREDFFTFYGPEYYRERYGDKNTYIKDYCSFATYAVLTPDGEWHEAGAMGWFGVSLADAEDHKRFRNEYRELVESYADGDYVACLIDCHI